MCNEMNMKSDGLTFHKVWIPKWFYDKNIKSTMDYIIRGKGHKKEVEIYIAENRQTEKAIQCYIKQQTNSGRMFDANTIGDRWIPKSLIKYAEHEEYAAFLKNFCHNHCRYHNKKTNSCVSYLSNIERDADMKTYCNTYVEERYQLPNNNKED